MAAETTEVLHELEAESNPGGTSSVVSKVRTYTVMTILFSGYSAIYKVFNHFFIDLYRKR